MKAILATSLCVALVSPVFASVDMKLTTADGTSLIAIPCTTMPFTIQLRLQLSRPDPPVGITGFNVALQLHRVWGEAQFKIVGRMIGTDATGSTLPDANWMSSGIDPVTGDDYDRVIGSTLSPKSIDVGLYNSSGSWAASRFPATVSIFVLKVTGYRCGDIYDITVGDPGTGIIVADDTTPTPNAIPVRRVGAVRVTEPEPAGVLLLAIGSLFLRRRRARFQRDASPTGDLG